MHISMSTKRQDAVNEALEWKDDYDIVVALAQLTNERGDLEGSYESLTVAERVALHVHRFDTEVANGGLHQFFFNLSGNYTWDVLDALREIGAQATLQVVEQALAVFPSSSPSPDEYEREAQMKAFGEEELARLDKLTDEYLNQDEDIFAHAAQYLRQHREDFL
jgi:hypothetical protein